MIEDDVKNRTELLKGERYQLDRRSQMMEQAWDKQERTIPDNNYRPPMVHR